MSEKEKFIFDPEQYILSGNCDLLKIALNQTSKCKIGFVFDIDGILANTPDVVIKDFCESTNIIYHCSYIDDWNSINKTAQRYLEIKRIPEQFAMSPQDRWYDPKILKRAKPYPSSVKLVDLAIKLAGKPNVKTITARLDRLMPSTRGWLGHNYPGRFLRNNIINSETKQDQIADMAKDLDFVIFIDDAISNIKAVCEANIPNCIAINVPLGTIRPNFTYENLLVVDRYPQRLQDLFPLYRLMYNVAHY